jgi:hypothetical protein
MVTAFLAATPTVSTRWTRSSAAACPKQQESCQPTRARTVRPRRSTTPGASL